MLYTRMNHSAYMPSFEWNDIKVTGDTEWISGATASKEVTLYDGALIELKNYAVTGTTSGDFEYGLRSNATGTGTVTASKVFFSFNKFQNANVSVNTIPTGTKVYAGTSTLGNTTNHNTLTLDGISWLGTAYGGYTQATTGNSTHNEVVLTNGAWVYDSGWGGVIGGYAANGNATDNTVTLSGTNVNSYSSTNIYGGQSGNSSADVTSRNTIRVTTKDNRVNAIRYFDRMQFDLGTGISSGDTMLYTRMNHPAYMPSFEWNDIKVKQLSSWSPGVNTPTLTLYTGATIEVKNYQPSIIGTVGDYEYGKRANVTGIGTVYPTALTLDGNKFQNATETPTASATDVHAGISAYGNTTNHNKLDLKDNAGTPLNFTNARAGYTKALNGGSESNTLNLLSGGSVTNGYAGYTEGKNLLLHPTDENDPTAVDTTKNADAKNNTVNINGGKLNWSGKLYGGYIATNPSLTPPNNVSAGNASDNTINIEEGTFDGNNEIYGGYTNGTGKATGNTVNLGKSDGTFSASTLNNTFIYGGASSGSASDVMTGNTLNVNTQNITARGVQNFGKTVFNLNSTTVVTRPTPNTLLTVSGGATTGLDWAGVEVNPGSTTFTPSTYEKHLFKAMHNGSGITFSNYAPYGAKEKIVGNLEYIIDTDNHTGTAGQDVYIDGYQFRNHTAAYSEATAHTDAWAGRTASGQTVTNNKLTFTGNATNAYGGLVENKKHNSDGTYQTAGSATKNTLDVTAGTLANAYGAKVTAKNGSADENNVNIASSVTGAVYGAELTGTGTGDATKSTVKITAGTVGGNVYGGKVAGTGAATGHTINLYGGSVGGSVYGGHTASGATTGNTVNLGSGTTNSVTTVTGTIYGGNQGADTNNVLNVNTNATAGNIANFGMVNFNFNSTFNQANPMLNLVGGTATNFDWNKFKHTGNAPSGTSVLMQNLSNINVAHYNGAKEISSTGTHEYTIDTDTNTATAKQILFGGYQFKDANVTPTTSDPAKDIWAGRSVIGNTTTNNILTINGTNHRDAYGGWTAGTGTTAPAKFNSTSNTVNLKAGSVRNIYGGFTSVQSGNATGNNVNISGGSVSGTVHGGYLSHASATGDATGNTITITGGTMGDVYGGFTAGTGATTGNTVNLGSAADAVASGTTIGTIYGGNKSAAADNTLNVYDSATARNIANFDKINFKATSTHITVGDTLLTLTTGATNFDWTKLHVDNLDNLNSSATSDRILTLMHTLSDIPTDNKVTGMQGVSLLYEFAFKKRYTDELIATVTKAAISDQTKSFVETRAAATDFINRGANLLAGPGIASAKKEAAVGKQENEIRGYHLWAAMDQGSVDTKTGSYAETKGYNLSLGWARELKGKSATLIVTPFVEYGKGKYDAYLDDGTHGGGNISYFGAGIMGRVETLKGLWAEAALHGGKVSSDYSGSVYTGSTSRYDSSNAYYAAHLGIGKEVKTNDKDKLNTYLRYFWSYQSGMQTGISSTGSSMSTDDYDFSAVNSNRMRLGFTYTHKDSEKSEVYGGLAWEYEFSGKAGASYQGYDTPSPSLRGGSAMIEAGYRFAPQGSRFSYDLHFTGWLGKRHGYTGGAHVNWAF